MKFEYFIAKRIISSKSYKSSVSAPIIKIGIAAIAIGIVVMMISIATGIGLQKKIREKAVAFNGHVTISKFDSNVSDESVSPISTQQDFYPKFKSVPEVTHVQAVASKFGLVRTETDFEGQVFKGVGTDYDWRYIQDFLIDGRLPDYTGTMSNEVLISSFLSKRLNLGVNDNFEMLFAKDDVNKLPFIRKFKIVGIFKSGFQELDETFMIGDIKHVQRLNKWKSDEIGHFEVFINDYNQLQQIGNKIYQNTPSDLNAETVSQKYASIFEWIAIFDNNTYGIIGIMILVAGINMITALLVLILERTQMIGILKALGTDNWSIRKVFLYNASYLVLLGLFWGNLIGLTLIGIQKYFEVLKFPNPEQYYVDVIPAYMPLKFVLWLNLGTFVVCMLMLIIPSVIVSKISPVKAIQFE